MEQESLRPCPFCGGEAEMRGGSSTKPYVAVRYVAAALVE